MENGIKTFKLIDSELKKLILAQSTGHNKSIFNYNAVKELLKSDTKFSSLKPLNRSQYKALKKALLQKLSIIQGPPGTGKTQISAAFVWYVSRLYKPQNSMEKILVTSSSNKAVDNLVLRIKKTGLKVIKIASRIRAKLDSINLKVEKHSLHVLLKNYIYTNHYQFYGYFIDKYENDELIDYSILKMLENIVKKVEQNFLEQADVICCTNIMVGDPRLSQLYFPFVLIDEASQSTEPEAILPLTKGCRHLVLVGDQMQLGPRIYSKIAEVSGLGISLMKRLIDSGIQPYLLQFQYRMHPLISRFPSEFYYEGLIINGVSSNDRPIIENFWPNDIPNIFLHNDFQEGSIGSGTVSNINEAFEVLYAINSLKENFVEYNRIVVITPYEGQKKVISEIFEINHIGIKVVNIDEFQGCEQDYVIFSTVRSNSEFEIGFLNDYRRMNVAITRAKFGLVVLGNCYVLKKSLLWSHLIKDYADKNMIFSGNFGSLKNLKVEIPDIAKYNFCSRFDYS